MGTQKLKAAVISAGMIANSGHIPAYKAFSQDVSLEAVCDLNASAARDTALRHDIPRWYSDVAAMLEEVHPDLVSVCTPNSTHKGLVAQALKAGANVICKKPLTLHYADTVELYALAEKLAEMEKRRGESRKARAKTGMPVVSLVGYTNVGKSSLMNALCGPSVAEADMLFATLDPTSRKLILPSGMAVLLVDTVGFVSRLPHNLVEAFKSTLEEAAWSDVIIRVADAGDEQREEQLAVTDEVLDGLDCADIPRLTVYNKCDKPGAMSFDPDILLTSAKTGYGLDTLLAKLDEVLSDRVHTLKVLLPYDKLGLAAPMRERGSVQVEEYREDGLYLEGIVKTEDLHCFEGYLV